MRQSNEVITSQIPRAELAGLLETMTPIEQQRVTAEFPAAAMPEEPRVTGEVAVVEMPGDDVVVRFMRPSIPNLPVATVTEPTRRLPSWAIVLGSCGFTLLLAALMFAAA